MLRNQAAAMEQRRKWSAVPITRVVPVPVRVRLGGGIRWVYEYRLIEVAYLQQRIAEAQGCPTDALPSRIEDPEPETRAKRLLEAWRTVKTWPPLFGTTEAQGWLYSREGQAYSLRLGLRRHRLRSSEAFAIAGSLSATEWNSFYRVVYGAEAWKEVAGELGLIGHEAGALIDWAEAFEGMSERYGWTPDEVARLTLSQWRAYRAGSATFLYVNRPKPGETLKEARERERRILEGAITPDPSSASNASPVPHVPSSPDSDGGCP